MNPHRPSSFHPGASNTTTAPSYGGGGGSSTNRARQHAHLHAQLATLHARLADTENLLRMTAVQAEYVRGLGGWMGALFMASSTILGEEAVAGGAGSAGGEGGPATDAAAAGGDKAAGETGPAAGRSR